MRLIARLDIKGSHVIKGINLEGLRKVGDPLDLAKQYYADGIDEIVYMDAVASHYGRGTDFEIIKRATRDIFIPVSIGGGIRSESDVERALVSGADKVVINSAFINNPKFLDSLVNRYGSSTIVASIEVKRIDGKDMVFFDNGREPSGLQAEHWAHELSDRGAGEILLTSVDKEGTGDGFDLELLAKVLEGTSCPLILSGAAVEGLTLHVFAKMKSPQQLQSLECCIMVN